MSCASRSANSSSCGAVKPVDPGREARPAARAGQASGRRGVRRSSASRLSRASTGCDNHVARANGNSPPPAVLLGRDEAPGGGRHAHAEPAGPARRAELLLLGHELRRWLSEQRRSATSFREPSTEFVAEKEQFGSTRRARWFGMRGVTAAARRFVSSEEDSGRWAEFPFRPGDIVISTRSKHGTTWMQMICALLVFQTPDLPAPLGDLSPWVDRLDSAAGRAVRRPRGAATPPVPQDPHAARRHPDRAGRHLHRRRPPPARRGGLALSPGREHRPGGAAAAGRAA